MRDDPEMKAHEVGHMTREERYVAAMKKTIHMYSKMILGGKLSPTGKDAFYLKR